ncbi:hypothetical protein GCM10012280_32340 [Wenjunlia tyrosinilytica]|uniref:Uncharacterized protein n=1 Tax=Wenjunlia tyrosinilytica TaxID=1544741 RepID=A0A917ZS51_9ACTN|nr:hypothetical protein GCM10012280_32340 [Wenjunlia tyrosinilytica]
MSTLMRAPRECGSWSWDLDGIASPGLASALAVAARMAEVLAKHSLLVPSTIEYGWYIPGGGGIGITTTLCLSTQLGDPELVDGVLQSRPVGFQTAEVDDIRVLGSGLWVDADGQQHRESGLLELEVSPVPIGLTAEVAVFHDIWTWYDFSGRPHPEVQRRNAPRLAAALRALDSLLGTKAEPGEPTYFGAAEGYGVQAAEPSADGSGPDLTDRL